MYVKRQYKIIQTQYINKIARNKIFCQFNYGFILSIQEFIIKNFRGNVSRYGNYNYSRTIKLHMFVIAYPVDYADAVNTRHLFVCSCNLDLS